MVLYLLKNYNQAIFKVSTIKFQKKNHLRIYCYNNFLKID